MLENYIQGKKIIIVGPSPHLIGKQKGSFIDSFDTVIRVNEFGITPDLEKDYGSRTDISFLTLSEEAIQIYLQMKEDVNYENLKLIVHPRDEYNFNPLTNIREEINVKEYYKLLNLNVDFYQITEPSFLSTRVNLFKSEIKNNEFDIASGDPFKPIGDCHFFSPSKPKDTNCPLALP